MKRILYTIAIFLICFKANSQFPNTQGIGSNKTFVKSLGALSADSGLIILNVFPDTTTANFSVVSKYNSFIRVGTNLYFRTLVPQKWNLLLSGTSSGFITPSDTATMLAPYYKTSTATSALATKLNLSDTATMLSARPLNNRFTDSIAAIRALANSRGGGSVTSIATNTGSGIAGGTITTTGTLRIDTSIISTKLFRIKGTDSVSNLVNVVDLAKVNISDTATMLSNRLKISDTATMLSPYARTSNLPSLTPYKLISDTLFNGGYTTRARTKQQTDSIIALIGSSGGGTVLSIATNTGSGITGGTITTTGTLAIDTTLISTKANVTALLLPKLNTSTAASTYVPYSGATTSLNLGANSLYGAASWENSAVIYSGTNFKTAGNYLLDVDSTGLKTNGGYRFYAVAAGLNAWYTPQPIVADKFVKIGGTGSQYLMADGTTTGTGGTVSSATYFPTLTNTTNISSSSLTSATYIRVDSMVTVYLKIGCTATSTSTSTITVSLPFSTSSSTSSGNGVFNDGTFKVSSLGTFTSTTAAFSFSGTASTAGVLQVSFQYKVL